VGKQEGGGKAKGKKGTNRRSPKAGAKTDMATTPNVAKEANVSSTGDNQACSDGRSGKNKCSNDEGTGTGDGGIFQERPLCYGGG